jgi:hypothetical protein
MPQTDQPSDMVIEPELLSGERILWTGQPRTSVIFHREDALLIPFSLLWGGFAVFWEASVLGLWGNSKVGPWSFGIVWGIPFVVIGQYLIWGRFFYATWLKKRTHYAVTNRRVIVVQNGWKRQMASAYIDSLPTLIKESGAGEIGILRFAQTSSTWSNRSRFSPWNGMSVDGIPAFVDVDNVDSVYRLVSDQREKSRAAKSES